MEPSFGHPWFALQVRSRHEHSVAVHLNGKGYEWFLPLYKSRRRWSDRLKAVDAPLFPGYVFCRFNAHARLPILVTPGVIGIVGIGKTPVAIEDSEIASIQTLVRSGLPSQPCPFLRIGEKVRIEVGSLSGLEGILLAFKGHHRLVLSITLLQRSVAVQIESACVSAAPQHCRAGTVGLASVPVSSRALA